MDAKTESGKSPGELAIAEVARIVRELPDDTTLEQLQGIVGTVADAFGVDSEEIDGSVREDADEAAVEAAAESLTERREETDNAYLTYMHEHSQAAIEAALEPVREKAREAANAAFEEEEEADQEHYDAAYAEAYRDAYRAGLLED
jgi:flagellar biosynthesis/type III secretory pathway protein FliH